jgi:site-specific DNA-methyltransferase (adenine-specific)
MSNILNTIINDDVLAGFKLIPDESVHLIVTSPPYNVKLEGYGNCQDDLPYPEYLAWLEKIMAECKRVLVKGGRLCINIDAMYNMDKVKDGESFRVIYADLVIIGRKLGLLFNNEIAWDKQNVVGKKTAWGSYWACSNPIVRRAHEYIIVWSKDDYRLEGDLEQCDLEEDEFQKWTMSVWHMQPETRDHNGHPAPFPEELPRRLIKLYSYRGNTVLDPFMGTGTTGYVAKMLRRDYIGIDNSESDVRYARARIAQCADMFEEAYIPHSERVAAKKRKKESLKRINQVFDE